MIQVNLKCFHWIKFILIGVDMKVRLSKCSISNQEIKAVASVMESEYLGMGSKVLEFESAIKSYLGTGKDVVCVNTGTSALHLALSSLGITVGDEVLVPSLTYVASFQAISATGAIPVACEVDSETLFLDVRDAELKITNMTKAIMPVHYASASKNMKEVYTLAEKYGIRVVEDAAQAFGCERNGCKIGVEGDIICFSFDGIKNITSGEGGAILSSDELLLERLKDCRLLGVEKDTEKRFSGQRSWEFDVSHQGFRFHMSNINAAIGIEQLKKISAFKEKRQAIVFKYLNQLAGICELEFLSLDYEDMIAHIFVVKVVRRDELRMFLISAGIECGVHYKPNHLLSKYQCSVNLPFTELVYRELLTLPCHVDLTDVEQDYVVTKLKEFYGA